MPRNILKEPSHDIELMIPRFTMEKQSHTSYDYITFIQIRYFHILVYLSPSNSALD